MEKIEGYNSRIKRLSELITLLEGGELSLDGLSEMELITRELHERSIILRYHAYKDRVIPEDFDDESEIDEEGGVEVEVIIEEIDFDESEGEIEEEEQAFDFAIFDTGESIEEPEILEPEALTYEPEVEEPEIVIEESVEIEIPEPELVEPELEPVAIELLKEEPKVVVETITVTSSSFLDQLKLEDNSIASRFTESKLDSLIGAFGLNQRLRYINDLFDGSSEIFSDAIKALDSQASLDAAKQKAAQFAMDHQWDPKEEIVIEFMSYLNRRYA